MGRGPDLRFALPAASVMLAVVADALPGAAGIPAPAAPALTIAVMLFWTMRRPDLLGPASILALTLVLDMLSGLPPGLSALAILPVRRLLLGRRPARRPRPFVAAWLHVTLALAAVELLRWTLACAYWQRWIAPVPVVHEAALTAALWPLCVMLLGPLARALPQDEHAAGR